MVISKFVAIAIVEFFVVILATVIIIFFAMRKKIKKLEETLKDKKKQDGTASETIAKNAPKTSVQPSKISLYYQKELDLARQQVINLEQFRDLYFSLEAAVTATDNLPKMAESLELTISDQQKEISALTQLLEQEKKRSSAEHQYAEELELAIAKLEASQAKMAKQVAWAKTSVKDAELLVKEHGEIKKKANALMQESSRKNIELINYKKMINQLKIQNLSGQEQSEKVSDLLLTLSKKDKEIAQLKDECDTLGAQYHELAIQSLDAKRETIDNSLNAQVDDVLVTLDKSSQELIRSRLDYQNLEDSLTDVPEEEMAEYQSRLNEADSRKVEAENSYRHVSSEVEAMVSTEDRKELKRIKDEFTKKIHEVDRNINEHTMILSKSLESDIEEIGDSENHSFEERYKNLERNVAKYKKLLDKEKQKNAEFEELRTRYVELESRYLSQKKI